MDPNTLCGAIIRALEAGKAPPRTAVSSLTGWLRKGGFRPRRSAELRGLITSTSDRKVRALRGWL